MTLQDAAIAVKGLHDVVKAASQRLDADLSYSKGISLLTVKNDLLLSYLHHLTLLVHLKLSGRALAEHQELVQELVRIRVILDKIRPLEGKLKYQIDKLVRKVQAEGDGKVEDDNIANDPLSFRPNPAAMLAGNDAASGSESEAEAPAKDGIYRPPRVAPTPYMEPQKGRKGKEKRQPPQNDVLADLATAAASQNDPYAESTSGLAAAPSLGGRRERELDDMDAYEESNLTRLFQTRKAAKRRREDEAKRAGVSQREGFGDLDDFVGAIASSSKRNTADYDVLRATKRPRETIALAADGSGPVEKGRKRKGSFKQAMSKGARKQRR